MQSARKSSGIISKCGACYKALGVTSAFVFLFTAVLNNSFAAAIDFYQPYEIGGNGLIDEADFKQVEFSPNGRYVVFIANALDAGTDQLFSVRIEGGEPTILSHTPEPGQDSNVTSFKITPDSARVIYTHSRDDVTELFSTPVNDGDAIILNDTLAHCELDITQICGDVLEYKIDPAGAYVVFLADQDVDDVNELYRVNTLGGVNTKLTRDLGEFEDIFDFRIGTNGERVVFTGNLNGGPVSRIYSASLEAPDGASLILLNNNVAHAGANVNAINFDINPGGDRVVFLVDDTEDGRDQLYSADIFTQAQSNRLSASLAPGGGSGATTFDVSPDGDWVAFVGDPETFFEFSLYSHSINGEGTHQNLSGEDLLVSAFDPIEISADGIHVVFLATEPDQDAYGLYSVTRDGEPTRLNPELENAKAPISRIKVDPTGRYVTYVAEQNIEGTRELYRVSLDGSDSITLSGQLDESEDASNYTVSPDGRLIAFEVRDIINKRILLTSIADGSVRSTGIQAGLNQEFRQKLFDPNSEYYVYVLDGDATQGGFERLYAIRINDNSLCMPIILSSSTSAFVCL